MSETFSDPSMHYERHGTGKPLLLIHGLGGSVGSWEPVIGKLGRHRDVIVIDLPGHGATPATAGSNKFAGLVDATTDFLSAQGLQDVDLVGSSMGARIVLELARRGHTGSVVSLDPGGFWEGWERGFFAATIGLSGRLVRALQPIMPAIAGSKIGRSLLLAQLSARPWALDPALVLSEMRSIAATSTFDALVRDLAHGPGQQGAASTPGRIVIGWGRQDRLCLKGQAARAAARFPAAELVWFDGCGHFPVWDRPDAAVELILRATA